MALDKIKRSFIWLRKALEITEKTTLPGQILGEVRPTLDTFGWDRLDVVTLQTAIATNSNIATTSTVPDGVMRVILAASVEHNDPAVDHTLWFDHRHDFLTIGVQTPALIIGATPVIRFPMMRRLLLRPGDALSGRASPATGVAITLTVRFAFVEIPVGEYIPPL